MSNVDAQELAKFSELAHRWWDPESEFRPLHQINPLRLQWIDELASLRGKQVLDVGCGGGILAESMARLGASVMGIDLAAKPLGVARLHAMEAGGKENGPPGLRASYSASYYAAFVFDPDGNNIEAVCHKSE